MWRVNRKRKLLEACSTGDPPTIHEIRHLAMFHSKAAKATDEFGSLPLHWLCRNKPSLEVVKCLVKLWPEAVKVKNKFGYRPLHYACANGARIEVVRYLLDQWPEAYWLPLKFAYIYNAPPEVTQYLMKQWPDAARLTHLWCPSDTQRPLERSLPMKGSIRLIDLSDMLVLSILSYLNSSERVKLRGICHRLLNVMIDSPEAMRIARRKQEIENELFQACKQTSCSVEKIHHLVQSHPDAVKTKCKEGWTVLPCVPQ